MRSPEETYRYHAKDIMLSNELTPSDRRLIKEMCISCMKDYTQSHILRFLEEIPEDIKSNEGGWVYVNNFLMDYFKKHNLDSKN
jgi:predicted RNA-binding protein YlxR (DUF448 family)